MSLEKSFNRLLEQNPDYSTLTCFNIAIEGKRYGKMTMGQMFKLVDKGDYSKEDKDQILEYCYQLTNEDKKINNED